MIMPPPFPQMAAMGMMQQNPQMAPQYSQPNLMSGSASKLGSYGQGSGMAGQMMPY
jgi:hypothetical protein